MKSDGPSDLGLIKQSQNLDELRDLTGDPDRLLHGTQNPRVPAVLRAANRTVQLSTRRESRHLMTPQQQQV